MRLKKLSSPLRDVINDVKFLRAPLTKTPFFLSVHGVERGAQKPYLLPFLGPALWGYIWGPPPTPLIVDYGIGDEPFRKEVTITNPFMNLTSS